MVDASDPASDAVAAESVTPAAQALVSAARRHLGMDVAFVAEFAAGRRIFRFVDAVPGAVRLEAGQSHELADTYCDRIVNGTIPEVIPDAAAEPGVNQLSATDQLGIASYIGVPVRHRDGRLFGTLCCLAHVKHAELGDEQRQYMAMLAETIAADVDRAAAASPGFRDDSRRRVRAMLDEQNFHPVFQPIVELATGRVVGAEALTRFTDDDRSPLAFFAEACTVGLGVELELATAKAALDVFDAPDDVYLALNLSPLGLSRFPPLLSDATIYPNRVVVELTEHSTVGDYEALQASISQLRAMSVRLAVDDTGAGISSLRHILELRPDIIKLDVALTRAIDTDPVRQALAEALAGFAQRIGAQVIAEGIENAAQLEAIASLGIRLGQGFHLGRPEPPPLPTEVPR